MSFLTVQRWPIYRSLVLRWRANWEAQERTPRLRLHLHRRRGRRAYHRCAPLRSLIGRWHLVGIDRGTGGPYNYDWYYWSKRYLPALRREPATRSYSVTW